MNTVTFGQYRSYEDLQLLLTGKTIGTAAAKTELIDIPGSDGVLDFTEYHGEVKYKNRPLSFTFETIVPPSQFMTVFSTVQNLLHGKRMQIQLSEEPDYYYIGRISVNEWKAEKRIGRFTVDCDCEPYKYKTVQTAFSSVLDNVSNNMYDMGKISAVHPAVTLGADNFYTIDAVNNGVEWMYCTFFHLPYETGVITPNQTVTIVLETKDFETSGADPRLQFMSNSVTQPDYFSPETYSTTLNTHKRNTVVLYPITVKDAATIAAATYFIRSFIALSPGSACKGKFRLSILPGKVEASAFTYVSRDGSLKGLQITNARKRATPKITASAAMTLYHEGAVYEIPAGVSIIPELELSEGINDIAVKGTGTISFAWQEGSL